MLGDLGLKGDLPILLWNAIVRLDAYSRDALAQEMPSEVGFEVLIHFLSAWSRGSAPERLDALFFLLDADADGRITQTDLVRVLDALAPFTEGRLETTSGKVYERGEHELFAADWLDAAGADEGEGTGDGKGRGLTRLQWLEGAYRSLDVFLSMKLAPLKGSEDW